MKSIKQVFLFSGTLLPGILFASGAPALLIVFSMMASLIVLLVFLYVVKLTVVQKAVLFFVYMITAFVVGYLFRNAPYEGNEAGVNLAMSILPLVSAGAASLFFKKAD